MRLLGLVRTTLLAVALLLGIAQAQAQIIGGTLYTAMPGTFSISLVEDRAGASLNWYLPIRWRTGPGDQDYAAPGDSRMICTASGSCTSTTADLTQRLGRTNSPAWSNNSPGTTLTSPILPANNVVIIGAHVFSDFNPDPHANVLNILGYTGDIPVGFLTLQPARFAAIFPGPNHTVGIGFPMDHFAPMSSNFLDYSIRIIVSNVCVK
jgi:hypothetical protein